jgi:hypothetical protein
MQWQTIERGALALAVASPAVYIHAAPRWAGA